MLRMQLRIMLAMDIPVRIFWNASSTLLASRAEVSIKDRWFSPGLVSIHSPYHAADRKLCIKTRRRVGWNF